MGNGNDKYATLEKASLCADTILMKMPLTPEGKEIPWDEWWNEYIVPNDSDPEMNFENHRHVIKNLINKEFLARGKSNRLFVSYLKGVYMLDGKTAVSSKLFLARMKKQASIENTSKQNLFELSQSEGLLIEDSRMLQNVEGHIDSHMSLFAGVIGRMRSLPRLVKIQALRYFGVEVD
ncbi:MAG TPA: hypothetical protein VMW10_09685 [Alphaproteobacteria bacterium]|nr:hypothetical protein [Alphaproteobacteria bacterium]